MASFIDWSSGYTLVGALKAENMISKRLRQHPEFQPFPANKLLSQIPKAKTVYELVDTFSPLFDEDVIFGNLWFFSWILFPIREILKKKTPIIQIPHGAHMDKFVFSDILLSYPFLQKQDCLIIGSGHLRNSLEKRFPKLNPIFLPTYGTEINVHKPISEKIIKEKTCKYGINPEKKHVTYIGTLSYHDLSFKFWSFLLEFFSENKQKYDATLVQIGGCQPRVKKILSNYKNVITTGVVPEEDLTALINSSAFTIHLSARPSDTMGIALLESLACGKPVLCTGWNGFEFIKNQFNGYRIKLSIETNEKGGTNLKFNQAEFEEKLTYLLNSSSTLQNNCIKTAQEYDIEQTVQKITKLCKNIEQNTHNNTQANSLNKPFNQFFDPHLTKIANIPNTNTIDVLNESLSTTKLKGYFLKNPKAPAVFQDVPGTVVPFTEFIHDYILP